MPRIDAELMCFSFGNWTHINCQWRKDGFNLSGEINARLGINPVSELDAGFYDFLACNDCGCETTIPFMLSVDGPLNVTLIPPGNAQGLDPLSFSANIHCGIGSTSLVWENMNTGTTYTGHSVTRPMFNETTTLQVAYVHQPG